jgi:hypothetical protein
MVPTRRFGRSHRSTSLTDARKDRVREKPWESKLTYAIVLRCGSLTRTIAAAGQRPLLGSARRHSTV